MLRNIIYTLKKFDWLLLGATVLLLVFGLSAIYSTSLGGGNGTGDFSLFWKQIAFAGIGLALMPIVASVNYRVFRGLARVVYFGGMALLAAVLVFGKTVRGTTGWFGFGGFGIQPVELMKFFLIVYLAKFFSDYSREPAGVTPIIRSGIATFSAVFLVLLQPDYGSAFLLCLVWGALLLAAGVKRSHLAAMALLVVAVSAASWLVLLKPYQKDRVAVFLDPSKDPQNKGFNVTQSLIAIGSGGVSGKGLGYGSQSQLRFLPERQTDFIFAVIGEELGFLGVLFVCGLFGLICYRGYRLASTTRDDFTLFLVLGVTASIAAEAFVNIGGNLRLIPVTGVTLPFVSYGGSSLLVKLMMVGVLESVAVRT